MKRHLFPNIFNIGFGHGLGTADTANTITAFFSPKMVLMRRLMHDFTVLGDAESFSK